MADEIRLILDGGYRVVTPIKLPDGAKWVGTDNQHAHFEVLGEQRERVVILPIPDRCRCRIEPRELQLEGSVARMYWLTPDEAGSFRAEVRVVHDTIEWYAVVTPVPIETSME